MALIHRIFRAQFAELEHLIRQVDDHDLTRRAAILDYLDFNLTGLHHHHHGEDTILWPLLEQRVPGSAASRMGPQHERIDEELQVVRALMAKWRAAPAGPEAGVVGADLADRLHAFAGLLNEHLDEEERLVVPLLAQHLTVREWQDFGKAMNVGLPRSTMPIMLGTLLEVATPTEAKAFIGDLPLPARLMIKLEGGRRYASYVARFRDVG